MSGTSAAIRSRRVGSPTRTTEVCWKSDFEEAENAAASSRRSNGSGTGRSA